MTYFTKPWVAAAALLSTIVGGYVATRPELGAEFTREATVVRAQGVGLAVGARCTVSVRNESRGGFPCRVAVVCDGLSLFGGSIPGGYAECTARQGRWVLAEDRGFTARDGDPALALDVERATVLVQDASLRVELSLGPALARPLARPLAAR
jgi:hypothetical protein